MDYKNNALYNQNLYNKLSQKEKDEFIGKVYKYYNFSLPIVEYNIKNIENQFNLLKSKQNFKIDDKDKKNIVIDDIDYKRNYIDYCSLSDYYQNKERIKCQVKKYLSPYDYYKKNYKFILNKYFSNMYRFYEDGLVINKIDFHNIKDSVNPIYLQNVIYQNNKFCTVFKPYLFKLLINIFRDGQKVNILDLSSGWGDRLIAVLSIQNDINLYVGIDPNKNLFKGYQKMINDLSEKENKEKFILINKPSQDVEFNELPEFDIIFWSPPFFDQEIYITDKNREDYGKQSINVLENYEDWEDNFLINTINKSANNLKKDGHLILYLGNINYKTFMNKMKNIAKLNYIGNLKVKSGDKYKNYIIYKKIEEPNICKIITHGDKKMIDIIKKHIDDPVNPKLKIIPINVNNKTINIIQEGYLLTGTKQRASILTVKKLMTPSVNTLVYAGSDNGFGPLATAYAAYHLGLQSEIFLSSPKNLKELEKTRQVNTLLALNAKIYVCKNFSKARNMEYDFSTVYTEIKDKYEMKKNYLVIPMGLNDKDGIMIDILSKQMLEASKDSILKNSDKTNIWLVSGSGGVAQSIHKAFPSVNINIFLSCYGKYRKNVIEWANNNPKVKIVNDWNIDGVENDYYLYYKTVKKYDDAIFPYVKKYGKDGDFIWNISSDDILFE